MYSTTMSLRQQQNQAKTTDAHFSLSPPPTKNENSQKKQRFAPEIDDTVDIIDNSTHSNSPVLERSPAAIITVNGTVPAETAQTGDTITIPPVGAASPPPRLPFFHAFEYDDTPLDQPSHWISTIPESPKTTVIAMPSIRSGTGSRKSWGSRKKGGGSVHSREKTEEELRSELDPEDEKWLRWVQRRAGSMRLSDSVDKRMFKSLLQLEDGAAFADRIFEIFDKRAKGHFSVSHMLASLSAIARAETNQKLRFIFDIYDFDGSGTIEKHEFALVLQSVIDANSLALSHSQVQVLTNALFEEVDLDRNGVVTFEELSSALDKQPHWLEQLQLSASRFLKPPNLELDAAGVPKTANDVSKSKKKRKRKSICPPYCFTPKYAHKHPSKLVCLIVYIVITIGLYLYGSLDALKPYYATVKKITEPRCQHYYALAHGFGMNLNFQCALLLVLMLRKSLTYIRNSQAGYFLPLDEAVYAHKVVGIVSLVFMLGHFLFHMLHFDCLARIGFGGFSLAQFLFSPATRLGWVPGYVCLTGWPILIIHIIMFIFSLPIIRRSGLFEVFFISHLLYIPYFVILIVHSDKFWVFVFIPGAIFIAEKVLMTRWIRDLRIGEIHIKEAIVWPSGVTQLIMNHPDALEFKAGDYIFLNIPAIARFEWHPFTISSAPENKSHITVHIRSLGQWTTRVHKYFLEHERTCGGVKISTLGQSPTIDGRYCLSTPASIEKRRRQMLAARYSSTGDAIGRLYVPVHIDGPYGAPSTSIYKAHHAVLICGGIGVTPFASILQSLVMRYKAKTIRCRQCEHTWVDTDSVLHSMKLRKVHFIWVVQDNRSIEWFVDILESLEQAQLDNIDDETLKRFVDVQVYVTSAKRMADLTSFAFVTALDLVRKKTQRCMISGLRNPAIPGRPNWQEVFKKIKLEQQGHVNVFYCGPRKMGKELRDKSEAFGFSFHKEIF